MQTCFIPRKNSYIFFLIPLATLLDSKHIAVYTKWLAEASTTWSVKNKPCQPVAVFTLKLIGVIGQDEERFKNLQRDNIFNLIYDVLNLRKDDLGASVKMAYTVMVIEFIKHQSGRAWIKETGKDLT